MKNLTEGNIYKTFILFAVPMVLAGILSQGYNIIDTMIAGRYLGDKGLAEVGASSAFITFVSSLFWGFGNGFGIYVAKLFGARDYTTLKTAVYNNLFLNFVVAVVISILIIIFRYPIIDILKTDTQIRDGAVVYLSIYISGLFFIMMSFNFSFILNALGSGSFPFVISLMSAVLNIGGNILAVAVMDWGVAGIAAATVFSAVVSNVCYIFKLRKCFDEMNVKDCKTKFGYETIKESFAFSIPCSVQQMTMYAATALISPMINAIGSAATASYNVITKIYDINANIYQNSAKTLSNYTAQCIGAGKLKTLKRGVKVGFLQGMLFLMPVLLVFVIFAEGICGAFFPENERGQAFIYSVHFVRFFLPFIAVNLINNLFHSFFRGLGSMRLLVICTALGSVARLLFTFMLTDTYGMYGVYAGWVLSWFVEAAFVLWIYFTGMWKSAATS